MWRRGASIIWGELSMSMLPEIVALTQSSSMARLVC